MIIRERENREDGKEKRERIGILGVGINQLSYQETMLKIEKLLQNQRRAQIATVNPEFVIEAQRNSEFKEVLNRTELSVADGIGIRAAAKFFFLPRSTHLIIRLFQTLFQGLFLIGPSVLFRSKYLDTIPETIPGSELSQSMAKLAQQQGYSIFLLGAGEGVAEEAARILKKKYPGLKVAGCYPGSPKKEEEEKIVNLINQAQPDILLVAYSAPNQELWIARNLNRFQKPLIAMGVGGTFDFIAGKTKRAPKWMQRLGLEWFYRLLQEPRKRLKRIYTATVVFPWLVWKEKIKG